MDRLTTPLDGLDNRLLQALAASPHLAGLKRLHSLDLYNRPISDAGLKLLTANKQWRFFQRALASVVVNGDDQGLTKVEHIVWQSAKGEIVLLISSL